MGQGKTLNLFSHRAPQSVWDRRGWHGVTLEERVGPWLVSMAGAGLLVYATPTSHMDDSINVAVLWPTVKIQCGRRPPWTSVRSEPLRSDRHVGR